MQSGEPIAPELLPSLFAPIKRGAHEDTPSGHSVGLGPYIVDEIPRAQGGSVAVRSTREAGTTFTASLPRG